MSRTLILALACMIFGVIVVSGLLQAKTSDRDITTAEASKIIDGKDANLVILDVRTPEEFKTGHLEKALNMDFHSADFSAQINKLDKSKNYLVYCRSGNRSAKAATLMQDDKFSKVMNMTGGITQWIAEKRPVVAP